MATTSSDSTFKKASDSVKKLANPTIIYQFDWFSVGMMGLVGVACVVLVTCTQWFLNRKT
jgi:hypothetical protein